MLIYLKRKTVKCRRHRGFNPEHDGEEAIRGNCERCWKLLTIWRRLATLKEEIGLLEESRS